VIQKRKTGQGKKTTQERGDKGQPDQMDYERGHAAPAESGPKRTLMTRARSCNAAAKEDEIEVTYSSALPERKAC